MTDLEDDQTTSNHLYTQAHKHFERAMDALQYLEKIDVEVGSIYLYTPIRGFDFPWKVSVL